MKPYIIVTVRCPNLISLYNPSDGLKLATVATLAGAASSPAGIVILGLLTFL